MRRVLSDLRALAAQRPSRIIAVRNRLAYIDGGPQYEGCPEQLNATRAAERSSTPARRVLPLSILSFSAWCVDGR
jgi:hypothetical protein